MKVRFKLLLFLAIYWIVLFVIARLFFLAYYFHFSAEIGLQELILSILYGLRLDLSATGYLLFFISFCFGLFFWMNEKQLFYLVKIYTYFFTFIVILLTISDLLLYKHWGFRLDNTPLMYLKTPKDAAASLDVNMLIQFVVFALLYSFIAYYLYVLLIKKVEYTSTSKNIMHLPVFLFVAATMILPIRGGFGIAPINPGTVYFSKFPFANHAALNVPWNAVYSITHTSKDDKVHYFASKEAELIFDNLHTTKDSTLLLLKTKRPNIILVLWESLTAKVVEPLGGIELITSNLNELQHQGVWFQHCFANGDRSDKGIVAVLSGYPAQPAQSIIKFAHKTQSLPFLSKDLKKHGYASSFYYGGDIDFANMRSYFLNGEFDKIYELEDFPEDQRNSKWGVHDHVVFNRLIADIKNDTSHFFKVLFTLSSHEPFDVPLDPVLIGDDDETRFLNSMIYTDMAFGNFIEELQQLPVWDSTLVILIADHGARHPGNTPNYPPEKFHVPMLWLGGALNVTDTVIHDFCSQIDIAATLLNQMNMDTEKYTFSKNIFSQQKSSFAFYTFNNGFGFFTANDSIVYDNISEKHVIGKSAQLESATNKGKAFLQVVMEDFTSR